MADKLFTEERTVDSYLLASPLTKDFDAEAYHIARSLLVYELTKNSTEGIMERIAKFGGIEESELIKADKQYAHLNPLMMAVTYSLKGMAEKEDFLGIKKPNAVSFNKISSILGGWDRTTLYTWYLNFSKGIIENENLVKEILASPIQEYKLPAENTNKDYWDDLNDVLFWAEEISKRSDFTINTCLPLISHYTNISLEKILGKKRSRFLVYTRTGATYLFREKLRLSQPAIGKYMNRDSTSILNQQGLYRNLRSNNDFLKIREKL